MYETLRVSSKLAKMAIVQKFLINAHINAPASRGSLQMRVYSLRAANSRGNVEILAVSVPANKFEFDVTLVTLTCAPIYLG